MTIQASEKIIIAGHEYSMSETPLKEYLTQIGKPEFFVKGFMRKDGSFCVCSSSHWRGYIGKWVIIEGALYLIGLTGYSYEVGDIDINSFFPNQKKVKAVWYSGKLKIPSGEILHHKPYDDIYEKDLIFEIRNGDVIKSEIIDNRFQPINLN